MTGVMIFTLLGLTDDDRIMNPLHDPAAQPSPCVEENTFLRIRVKHRNHPGFSETCLAAGSFGDLRWRLHLLCG
jgi:hypothetical protein